MNDPSYYPLLRPAPLPAAGALTRPVPLLPVPLPPVPLPPPVATAPATPVVLPAPADVGGPAGGRGAVRSTRR